MVQKNEIWTDYKVTANNYQRFIFKVDENQKGFKIKINSHILETDKNIIYHLSLFDDSERLTKWMRNKYTYKRDSNGNIVKDKNGYLIQVLIPPPEINEIINVKTNMLEKTISLSPGVYALMFDNTYSAINAKNVWLHVIEIWDEELSSENLPIIEHLLEDLPEDVGRCVLDANNCFTSGHYNQCSVMLRKAIEIASKIKLQQSTVEKNEIFDNGGNEIGLTGKVKLLRKHKLITQHSVSDLDQIKWFGNIAAHGTMNVTIQDIKDNVEPKTRSFLVGLNLKV